MGDISIKSDQNKCLSKKYPKMIALRKVKTREKAWVEPDHAFLA
jgi:hypothetical protein